MELAPTGSQSREDDIRDDLRVHGVIAEQDIDEGRLVLRPGAHQNVGLSQKEDGRHAVRDVPTLCTPDLCCTHRSGTGVHGICNGLEVIQWTTTAEGIDQEVRDWSQLKLLQPER